jgi:hypothetical protein
VTFAAPDGDTLRTGDDSADESVTALTFDGESEFGGDFDQPDNDFDSDGTDPARLPAPQTPRGRTATALGTVGRVVAA